MTGPIQVLLIVEDVLSDAVLRKMLDGFPGKFIVRASLGKEGFGYIQKNMAAFNKAAETVPLLVLTDLDNNLCPTVILRSWLREPLHPNLVFRVAIREVEAWLLAHREAIARYLKVRGDRIPQDSETIPHPKEFLINLARDSLSPEIRDAIVPGEGRKRKVGPDYNGCLLRFVYRVWDPEEARNSSRSLHRALLALDRYAFHPERDFPLLKAPAVRS
jgi:hypothetical protein